MKNIIFILFILAALFVNSGCSTMAMKWKNLISDGQPANAQAQQAHAAPVSYSNQDNLTPPVYRDYRRMTKKEFENQARLDSRAGSLWVMEGQGSYLFAQNVVRMIGDPVTITLEGAPKKQLEQKAEVISSLLKQLDMRRNIALSRNVASQGDASAVEKPAAQAKANDGSGDDVQKKGTGSDVLSVQNVPTRITERLVDGNYRVQGMQPFMIGNREYKVIVSGIVKSEDFNENGISASALLDPSFDVVSSKHTEMN